MNSEHNPEGLSVQKYEFKMQFIEGSLNYRVIIP